jgi:hypothetical protein
LLQFVATCLFREPATRRWPGDRLQLPEAANAFST